jgi:hypothetical protein
MISMDIKDYKGVDRKCDFLPIWNFFPSAKKVNKLWDWYIENRYSDTGIEYNDENLEKILQIKKILDEKGIQNDILIFGTDANSELQFIGYDVVSDAMFYSAIVSGIFSSKFAKGKENVIAFENSLNQFGLFSQREDAERFADFLNMAAQDGSNSIEDYLYICINVYLYKWNDRLL